MPDILNTNADLEGRTLVTAEGNYTIDGLHTFDRGTSAPFAVVSGAAKVSNLDADKLDGQTGSYYTSASNMDAGTLPIARYIGADPNADRVHFWDDSAGAAAFLELVGLAIRGTQLILPRTIPNGRLTLTTATPVTTADVTAATTLYYALYGGNQIALYNGTAWEMFVIAELSIAVPAVANQVYDAFVDYNSGTPALTLTAWTNDTTRATALTTQDGVLVLTGTLGKRYVGTVRTVTASQLNDSFALRHVWNYYNRVSRPMRVVDTTDNWVYTTATMRQANGSAANQLDFVCGVAEDAIEAMVYAQASNDNAAVLLTSAIGLDSTTAAAANSLIARANTAVANNVVNLFPSVRLIPAVGRHILTWLEYSAATGITTWYGDAGTPTLLQSGIHGMWKS